MMAMNTMQSRPKSHNAAVLSLVVVLLLASDCVTKFGAGVSSLKIPALLIFAGYGMSLAFVERVDKRKILLCLVATVALYLEMPFQDALESYTGQLLFFALLAVTVVCAPLVLDTKATLRRAFVIAFAFVILMMLWSIPDIISQLHFYGSTSRLRIKGCFSNPNSLGHISAFLVIMFVSSAPAHIVPDKKKGAAKSFLVIAVLLLFIVASGSNTALIETIAFLVLVFIGNRFDRFTSRARTLCVLLLIVSLVVVLISLFNWAVNQETFRMRLESLTSVSSEKASMLVGLGYVSSSDISSVTQAAGGVVDMLWVSLLYRVGIVGYVAYFLYFLAAYKGAFESKSKRLIIAFLAAVLLQSMAESYLSSVMSFVSWFIWAFGSALPTLNSIEDQAQEEATKFPCKRNVQ